eukprot:Lithocolla_globosa_v1_NODE_2452_length_1999_cov_12.691872.p2 type:complete len:101 gc:universal NODE_2452_length_1999_cov_12.691872:571-269(-)
MKLNRSMTFVRTFSYAFVGKPLFGSICVFGLLRVVLGPLLFLPKRYLMFLKTGQWSALMISMHRSCCDGGSKTAWTRFPRWPRISTATTEGLCLMHWLQR